MMLFCCASCCVYRNDAGLLCIMLRLSKWCWFIVHHAAIIKKMLIYCASCCDYHKDAGLLCIMLRLSEWCWFVVHHAAFIGMMLFYCASCCDNWHDADFLNITLRLSKFMLDIFFIIVLKLKREYSLFSILLSFGFRVKYLNFIPT